MFDIRNGEVAKTLIAALTLCLLVGAYTVVKAVRDAIFLTDFGMTDLSLMAIGLAFLAGACVTAWLRVSANRPRGPMMVKTYAVISVSLLAFWVLLNADSAAPWLAWALYVWSSLFGVFILMQFWLMAGDIFAPSQAVRLFGAVATGAIVGGLFGGLLSNQLAPWIGTVALLPIAAVMLLAAAFGARWLWANRGQFRDNQPAVEVLGRASNSTSWQAIFGNRKVRRIALIMLIATMATTLMDWQFKAIAKVEFAGHTDQMAAFFGSLYAWVSFASLLLQTLMAGWLLRRLGPQRVLYLLPITVFLGFAAIVSIGTSPASLLAAASGAKIAEGGFRFGLDKSALELSWLSVSSRVRARAKALIDTVVDRLATGLTASLWLLLTALGLGDNTLHVFGVLGLVLVVCWFLVLRESPAAAAPTTRSPSSAKQRDTGPLPEFRAGVS